VGAYNKPLPYFSPNTKQKHSSDPVMASKKPAKKAPAKKAPAPKKAPVKAAKPASKAAKAVKKAPAKATKKSPAKAAKKVTKPVAKKPALKKVAKPSKVVAKKTAPKKPAPKKVVKPAAKAPVKAAAKPSKVTKAIKAKAKVASSSNDRVLAQQFVHKPKVNKNLKLTPFLTKQRQRLLELKDTLLDAMRGVARDNLHSGSDTSAFGMHQADAGSDAYDRDFALSMLSKEQGSLYEIDEALKRVEDGTYGVCDLCQKPIKHERLEALPFTRYTVDCQASLEKNQHHNSARPQITSLFGLTEEESESEEEDTTEIS
jgi:RNA polymerase-binding transcription factor DksA